MAKSYFGFLDVLQAPEFYTTRTVTDSSALGSSVAGFPASNVFTRNLYVPFKRSGLASGQDAILDLDLVQCNADGTAGGFAIGVIAVMGLRAPNNVDGREATSISVQLNANSGGFASSGGQTANYSVRPASGNPQHAILVVGGGVTPVTLNRYVRIRVSAANATGSATINVGRIMVMPVISGAVSPEDYAISHADNSEIVTAYDGTPYRLSRIPSKTVAFTMRGLSPSQVTLTSPGGTSASWVNANRHLATKGDAVFVSDPTYTSVADYSGCTYGRLDGLPTISMDLPGGNYEGEKSQTQTYSASATLIETPFG